MTQTIENQLTQEELLLKLQEQINSLTKKQDELLKQEQLRNSNDSKLQQEIEALRQKEIKRSRPFWQKLND